MLDHCLTARCSIAARSLDHRFSLFGCLLFDRSSGLCSPLLAALLAMSGWGDTTRTKTATPGTTTDIDWYNYKQDDSRATSPDSDGAIDRHRIPQEFVPVWTQVSQDPDDGSAFSKLMRTNFNFRRNRVNQWMREQENHRDGRHKHIITVWSQVPFPPIDSDPRHVVTETIPWPLDPTFQNEPPRPFLLQSIHDSYAWNEPIRSEHIRLHGDAKGSDYGYFWNEINDPQSYWYPFPSYVRSNPFGNFAPLTNGNYKTHGNCLGCLGLGPLGDICLCTRKLVNPASETYDQLAANVYQILAVDGVCLNPFKLANAVDSSISWGPGRRLVRWSVPPRCNLTEGRFLEIFERFLRRWPRDVDEYDAKSRAQEFYDCVRAEMRVHCLNEWRKTAPQDQLDKARSARSSGGVSRSYDWVRDQLVRQQQQERARREARRAAEERLQHSRELAR